MYYVKNLLAHLNYSPPPEYLPVYFFEEEGVVLHPFIKEELKTEIYQLKSRLIEPCKNIILELTAGYRNNISYNFTERIMKEGYFIIEIESPDPSVGMVSFVVTPWITPLDVQLMNSLCAKSNTVNVFVSYPNYPQIKSMFGVNSMRYNFVLTRDTTAYPFLKKEDQITRTILAELGKHWNVVAQQEKPREIEGESHIILEDLENLLRNCIKSSLENKSKNWWLERIPPDVRERAEERRQKDESKKEQVLYLDFGDYTKIITRRDNWRDVFSQIFGDLDAIKVKLKELTNIRNSIAHNRQLTTEQKEKFALLSREITSQIRSYNTKKRP